MNNKLITYKEAIEEALAEECSRDPGIVFFGEQILDPHQRPVPENFPHPDRVLPIPLIEDMFGAIGLGMALGGLKPIITLNHAAFLRLAVDDIHRLGIWRYRMAEPAGPGVVFRICIDSYTGKGAEFSPSHMAMFFHMPNIYIAAPSSPCSAKGLLKTAIRANRPVLFFEHTLLYDENENVSREEYLTPFPCSRQIEGKDMTLIAWSFAAGMVLKTAHNLRSRGITPEIIILETIYPFDKEGVLRSAVKTKKVIIVEDEQARGGIGAELAAAIAENVPGCIVRRVGAKNIPPGWGKYEKCVLPVTDDVVNAALQMHEK